MRAILRLAAAATLVLAGTAAQGAGMVSPEFVAGKTLPAIDIIDDNGRVRSTEEWKGIATILAPIYSRCPLACPLIAKALKRGAARSTASLSSYRVVLFSFDPRDTPADLRAFRQREQIPLGWTIAVAARPGDARRLLDAAGYRYGDAGGQFTHPNAVIALTSELKTAQYVAGTSYDIDNVLAAARGESDWTGRYGGWMLAALLLACLLSAIYLLTLAGA
jgi:cytochrome oxidase Cu insertion factor (SCO1/SenC/PrrC family)